MWFAKLVKLLKSSGYTINNLSKSRFVFILIVIHAIVTKKYFVFPFRVLLVRFPMSNFLFNTYLNYRKYTLPFIHLYKYDVEIALLVLSWDFLYLQIFHKKNFFENRKKNLNFTIFDHFDLLYFSVVFCLQPTFITTVVVVNYYVCVSHPPFRLRS